MLSQIHKMGSGSVGSDEEGTEKRDGQTEGQGTVTGSWGPQTSLVRGYDRFLFFFFF